MRPKSVSQRTRLAAALLSIVALYVLFAPDRSRPDYPLHAEASPAQLTAVEVFFDPFYPIPKLVYLKDDAATALLAMKEEAKRAGIDLVPLSGFRTLAYQQALYLKKAARLGTTQTLRAIAPAGHSEHHTGYAVDFAVLSDGQYQINSSFAESSQYRWLTTHAGRFGFELSYPGDRSGTNFEPWHWRFVGTASARLEFSR